MMDGPRPHGQRRRTREEEEEDDDTVEGRKRRI